MKIGGVQHFVMYHNLTVLSGITLSALQTTAEITFQVLEDKSEE